MPREPIDDLDDPRLAIYRNLKATNETRDSGLFVLEGIKLLDALLASRYPIASALVTDSKEAGITTHLPPDVPLFVVPHGRIDDLVGYNFHQGVLCSGHRRTSPTLDAILEQSGPECTLTSVNSPVAFA